MGNKKFGTVDAKTLTAGQVNTGFKATSTAYSITDTDGYVSIFVTTGASDKDITLPMEVNNPGRILEIKKIDSGAGNVVIKGTVDGLVDFEIRTQYDVLKLQCDGISWYVLNFETTEDIEVVNSTQQSQSSAAQNIWYNPGSVSITIPKGTWDIGYAGVFGFFKSGGGKVDVYATLGTTASTTDDHFASYFTHRTLSQDADSGSFPASKSRRKVLTSTTTYYMNVRTTENSTPTLYIKAGSLGFTLLTARRIK